jgi:hypothetical protein
VIKHEEFNESAWRTASVSTNGNSCVEVNTGTASVVGVRDSKNRAAGHLTVATPAWSAFLDSIKAGDFDLR